MGGLSTCVRLGADGELHPVRDLCYEHVCILGARVTSCTALESLIHTFTLNTEAFYKLDPKKIFLGVTYPKNQEPKNLGTLWVFSTASVMGVNLDKYILW